MGKDVVIIASGETERRSLPHLLAHLRAEGITILEVRIPPGGKALNVEMAERLLKASWFERIAAPPDKFVILADTDGKNPDESCSLFAISYSHASARKSARKSSMRTRNGILRPGTLLTYRGCESTWGEIQAMWMRPSPTKFETQKSISSTCWGSALIPL